MVDQPEHLLERFRDSVDIPCSGFTLKGHTRYLFLRSPDPNGADTYDVVRKPQRTRESWQLIDQIHLPLRSKEQTLITIWQILAGGDGSPICRLPALAVDAPENHECRYCQKPSPKPRKSRQP
jgi:hypothetical protein